MKIINVPKRLTFETASDFGCTLADVELNCNKYILDFTGVGRIEPFALLYLGSEIQRFKDRIGTTDFSVQGHMKKRGQVWKWTKPVKIQT